MKHPRSIRSRRRILTKWASSPQPTLRIPLPDGLQPSIYFIDSNTNVPTSDTAGCWERPGSWPALSHELGAATQSLTFGIDYKHFRNTTGFDDNGSSLSTPVSYLNLSLAYRRQMDRRRA